MTRTFQIMLFAGLAACRTFAFEAVLNIQPPLIDMTGSATLSIEVRGAKNPSPPALPEVPGLRMVSAGQSQQSTWVNGKSDSFVAFNYTVYPQRTGTFSIGPFDYRIGKETVKLGGQLKVIASSADDQAALSWNDLLFARLSAGQESVYVQEPVELTLSIFSRQGVQLAGNINLTGMPEIGLAELKWQEIEPARDVIDGSIFDIRRFRAVTRALSAGPFEFAPTVSVQVAMPSRSKRRNGMFDDPFFNPLFSQVETRPVDLQIEKTVLQVKPLPDAGKPAGFTGAVGRFEMQVDARPRDVHPGDPVTLTVRISGSGNFDRIMMPRPETGDSFRLFGDPVRKQEEGAVIFEQVISPRNATVAAIPPLSFSFFDTQAGRYLELSSDPLPLTVTASSNSTAQVFAAKETLVLPAEETPFAAESDLQRIGKALQAAWETIRPWLWTAPVSLLAAGSLIFSYRIRRRMQQDTARIRRQRAPRDARAALKQASRAIHRNDSPAFYDALRNALTGYFAHRMNLQPGAFSDATVLNALGAAGFTAEQTEQLRSIFENIDACRYGSGGTGSDPATMRKMLAETDTLLKLSERIKRL